MYGDMLRNERKDVERDGRDLGPHPAGYTESGSVPSGQHERIFVFAVDESVASITLSTIRTITS